MISPYRILVLGGREGSKPMPLSEYFVLDLKRMHWMRFETSSRAPKNRYAHSAVARPAERQILIFAGHGGRSRYYSDIAILQLPHDGFSAWSGQAQDDQGSGRHRDGSGWGWFRRLRQSLARRSQDPSTGDDESRPGSPRGDAATAFSDMSSQRPSVDGATGTPERESGSSDGTLVPEEESDLSGATWVFPTVSGTPPSKRSGHSMTVVGQTAIVVGGFNGKAILQDIHCLRLDTFEWSSPRVSGSVIPPRVGHSTVAVPKTSQLLIYGGSCTPNAFATGIDLLDTDVMVSTSLAPPMAPPHRFWHRCVVVHHSMYCFGGSGERGGAFQDVHALDLSPLMDGRMTEALALASSTGDAGEAEGVSLSSRSREASAPQMAVGLGGVGRLSEAGGSSTVSPTVHSVGQSFGSEPDPRQRKPHKKKRRGGQDEDDRSVGTYDSSEWPSSRRSDGQSRSERTGRRSGRRRHAGSAGWPGNGPFGATAFPSFIPGAGMQHGSVPMMFPPNPMMVPASDQHPPPWPSAGPPGGNASDPVTLAAVSATVGLTALGVDDPAHLDGFHLAVPRGPGMPYAYVPLGHLLARSGVSSSQVQQVANAVLRPREPLPMGAGRGASRWEPSHFARAGAGTGEALGRERHEAPQWPGAGDGMSLWGSTTGPAATPAWRMDPFSSEAGGLRLVDSDEPPLRGGDHGGMPSVVGSVVASGMEGNGIGVQGAVTDDSANTMEQLAAQMRAMQSQLNALSKQQYPGRGT